VKYLKWIWSSLQQIKGGFYLALVLLTFETAVNLTSTYLQKYLIDDTFVHRQFDRLPMLLTFSGLLIAANSLLGIITPYVFVRNEYKMVRVLLTSMMKHFYRFPLGQLQRERTGRFVQNMTSDLHETGSIVGFATPRGIQQIMQTIALIVIIGLASPYILLSILVIGTLYVLAIRLFSKPTKDANAQVQAKRTDLTVHLEEGLSSTREVLAFHRGEWEAKKYKSLFARYYEALMKEAKVNNRQVLAIAPLRYGTSFIVLAVGGYALIQGNMTLGTFVIVLQFTNQLMEGFQNMFNWIMQLIAKFAFIDRLQSFFDLGQMDAGKKRLTEPVKSLRFEGVGFAYETGSENEQQVLSGMTAELPIGSKIAFVGASGAGKSTIAQLLMRFYEPGEGQITVNGMKLSDIQLEDWMSRVQIVFQEPYLLADTISRNVSFGRDVQQANIEEAVRVAQLHKTVEQLPKRLEEQVGERGIQLSGGQRQRLSLARAIIGNPEILILDEATSALDMETERELQRRMDELRAGKTTIIIAHRLSTIQNADVIFVMEQGRVAEKGTHEQLLAEGRIYPELVRALERQELAG
jgi:ABC-type multidrug transport system fused ATPase/permease subunit